MFEGIVKTVVAVELVLSFLWDCRSTQGNHVVAHVPVADSVADDLFSSLEMICSLIDSHVDVGSRVLIVSGRGRSRCAAVAVAFLMHRLKHTLEEAWKYVLKCKPDVRPNAGFLQQLSDWELHTVGKKVTDISGPHF